MNMNGWTLWILISLAAFGGLGLIIWNSTRRIGKVVDLVDKLTTHPSKSYQKRSLSWIEQIIIHHTAGSQGPRDIARYHVETNDWPGIGYHFVIDAYGTIYQTNELDTLSYHCAGQNTRSIGVALIGNFELAEPTPMQYTAAHQLVSKLYAEFPGIYGVFPHKNYSATACPGRFLDLKKIIA